MSRSEINTTPALIISQAMIFLMVGLGLLVISRQDYLLFHSLAEIFSIVISLGIFMFAWNSRYFQKNHYLVFVGIIYLFVGGIDLLHMLSYKGMGVFTANGSDRPTQLWLIARYVEALSLLTAPLFLTRKIWAGAVLGIYTPVVGGLLLSVFWWQNFPPCFVEGTGLTMFKKASEMLICAILAGAAWHLYRKRALVDTTVFALFLASIAVTIVSELAFTLYSDVYGMFNIVGHFLKIVSFYLIYAAIIHMGLQKPYSSLFSDLAHSEKKYRSLFEAMLSGFAHHKIICDKEGNPVDYRFLSVNPAFESLTGLRAEKLIGKTVLEVMPETEPHWIQRYGSVALSGKPAHFEEFSGALDKHYRISAFSPAKGEFACIFQDVTEQTKSAEEREELIEQLKEALERVKTLQDIIPICSYCKQIRDDEGAWTRLEEYFLKYSDARFSHGICPDCYEKQVQQMDKDEKPS